MTFIIARSFPEYKYIIEYAKMKGMSTKNLESFTPDELPLGFDMSGSILGWTSSLNRNADYIEFYDFITDIQNNS